MTEVFKTDIKVQKKCPPFPISFFFHNKGFDYINLSSILHLDIVKNLFPDKLIIDEPPPVVYSLGKTIRNKILNYKETISSIYINVTHRTGIVECNCQQDKESVDGNHGHISTGDLRIIINSKLRKVANSREAMLINWNKCKRE